MHKLTGLIAAPHTPMHDDASLHLDVVDLQAQHYVDNGVTGAFVAGTTGEGLSLSMDERMALAEHWIDATRARDVTAIIQVGHTSLPEAQRLAAHAQSIGADAISTLAPCFFKPANVAQLVDYCAAVASHAPDLPFYYYNIPCMTGVELPMEPFLVEGAAKIPTLVGIKYTSGDFRDLQKCLRMEDGRFDILFGQDDNLLAGMAFGARGAVGSTYNFAAPLYHRIIRAFEAGDMETARAEQAKSVAMICALQRFGFMASAKSVMKMLGVDCGPPRAPVPRISAEQFTELKSDLRELGFFEWAIAKCVTSVEN